MRRYCFPLMLALGLPMAGPALADDSLSRTLELIQQPIAELHPATDADRPHEVAPPLAPGSDKTPVERIVVVDTPEPVEPPDAEASTEEPMRPDDSFSVTARAEGGEVFRIGDTLRICVRASRDAYLTLIDVGTSGEVFILFPNEYQDDNRIEAGRELCVPGPDAGYAIRVDGPPGRELVKVLATRRVGSLLRPGRYDPVGGFRVAKDLAPAVAKDLRLVLHRDHQASGWAEHNLVIEIVEP